jgi:hypothetical protein
VADEARLHDLLDLVEQARAEGDKDTETRAIAAYRRESTPNAPMLAPPGSNPVGMGPMDAYFADTVGRGNRAAASVGREFGVTAAPKASGADLVTAPLETAAHYGTGLLGTIGGGLSGIGQGLWNSVVPESMEGPSAADRVRQVQQALTYEPRTYTGQMATAITGLPGRTWGEGTNMVGEKVADVTGSPLLGSIVKTAGDLAPGAAGGRLRAPVGEGPRTPSGPRQKLQGGDKFAVPTTEQLKAAAGENYAAAENSGVVIRPDSTRNVIQMMQQVADKENLGKLPPKLAEAANVLRDRIDADKPLTMMEADKVRQLIGDAMKSTDAADRRLAKIIQTNYDRYLTGLGRNDTLAGDAAQANAFLGQARELYKRGKNSELVDSLERKAEKAAEANFTQAGLEHSLRKEFLKLSNNDKKMRMLSPEQRKAIEKVAAPGPLANLARFAGKFDPTSGPIPFAISVGTGGLLPLVGMAGRRVATNITKGNVANARAALVGKGMPSGPLRATGTPKPVPVAEGAAPGAQGSPTLATPRTPRTKEQIQRDIQALGARLRIDGSADIEQLMSDFARLQSELAATRADR